MIEQNQSWSLPFARIAFRFTLTTMALPWASHHHPWLPKIGEVGFGRAGESRNTLQSAILLTHHALCRRIIWDGLCCLLSAFSPLKVIHPPHHRPWQGSLGQSSFTTNEKGWHSGATTEVRCGGQTEGRHPSPTRSQTSKKTTWRWRSCFERP